MPAALFLTVCGFAVASPARQEAGRVVVPVGALDKEGRAVEGLKAEDLRVTVEGQGQTPFDLSQTGDGPLHVVILLDASASQEVVLPFAQEAADRLVPAILMRGRSNDAAVVSFAGEAKVVQALTADAEAVRRAIASVRVVLPPGYNRRGGVVVLGRPPKDPAWRVGSTAIWDALVGVCDKVFAGAKAGRRAVVLVSDGVDTGSNLKPDKAVERLLREGVAVYGVGITDESDFNQLDKGALQRLSERTGGRALFPKKSSDLPVAFEQIRRELLNSYALTFAAPPVRRDKPLKLRVELVNQELRKQGVRLAYPQSFVVESAPARP